MLADSAAPSWYARPGKKPRNSPGDSSLMCAGMTPHAPWTKNWIRNPPSAVKTVLGAATQSGTVTSAQIADVIIARRRPIRSE